MSATDASPAIPAQIGRFRILKQLGKGGMGTVYLAEDTRLHRRQVALKIPRFDPDTAPERLKRFLREARAAALLNHPNICQVYDVLEDDDKPYIVMAYIEGQPLNRLLSAGRPLPPPQAVRLIHNLSLTMQFAHENGVLHRDLKPANIILTQAGDPIIMDFGLAKIMTSEESLQTASGMVIGTPAYMSPEQMKGDLGAVGPHSDQYALGIILHELLTGKRPFDGAPAEIFAQVLYGHHQRSAQPPANMDVLLHRICWRAMARAPQERFATCAELAKALEKWLSRNVAAAPSIDAIDQTTVAAPRQPAILPPTLNEPSPTVNAPPLEEPITNSIGMKLRLIPAGEFYMGAADSEKGAADDERPRHRVRITKPFYIGLYPVTQRDYEAVTGINPSYFHAGNRGGLEHPVEQVSWEQAVEFCKQLTNLPDERRQDRVYRLLTEAEWEYACRAGSQMPFSFGPEFSSAQGNFDGSYPYGGAPTGPNLKKTSQVGAYTPNFWGIFDMHGNVWEWCADWYERDYYRRSPPADPAGPSDGSRRVLRGGSWYYRGQDCRAAYRLKYDPGHQSYDVGFRVAMTIAEWREQVF